MNKLLKLRVAPKGGQADIVPAHKWGEYPMLGSKDNTVNILRSLASAASNVKSEEYENPVELILSRDEFDIAGHLFDSLGIECRDGKITEKSNCAASIARNFNMLYFYEQWSGPARFYPVGMLLLGIEWHGREYLSYENDKFFFEQILPIEIECKVSKNTGEAMLKVNLDRKENVFLLLLLIYVCRAVEENLLSVWRWDHRDKDFWGLLGSAIPALGSLTKAIKEILQPTGQHVLYWFGAQLEDFVKSKMDEAKERRDAHWSGWIKENIVPVINDAVTGISASRSDQRSTHARKAREALAGLMEVIGSDEPITLEDKVPALV